MQYKTHTEFKIYSGEMMLSQIVAVYHMFVNIFEYSMVLCDIRPISWTSSWQHNCQTVA